MPHSPFLNPSFLCGRPSVNAKGFHPTVPNQMPLPKPSLPQRPTKRRPKVSLSSHKNFPSRLERHLQFFFFQAQNRRRSLRSEPKSRRARFKRRSSCRQVQVGRPPSTFPPHSPSVPHNINTQPFQPENVTTQYPILPLFSMPQEPWEALTRFTPHTRSQKTPSSRQSFPKVKTQMSTRLTSVHGTFALSFCKTSFTILSL